LQLCIETESDAYTTGRMFIAHKSHWGQVGEYLSEQIKHSDKMLDRSVYKPYTAVILVNTTYDSMSVSYFHQYQRVHQQIWFIRCKTASTAVGQVDSVPSFLVFCSRRMHSHHPEPNVLPLNQLKRAILRSKIQRPSDLCVAPTLK